VADVDLETRTVYVERTRTKVKEGWREHTTKNGEPRQVPIPAALTQDLRTYVGQHPHADQPTAPFWPGRKIVRRTRHGSVSALDYDAPWSPGVFYKRWFKPAVADAALTPSLRLHDLRHSFASICASAGIPAAQVAEWMGHGNEVVTRTIYTHLFKDDTTRHADALSAAFRPGPSQGGDELAARRATRGSA
jgi:integrase